MRVSPARLGRLGRRTLARLGHRDCHLSVAVVSDPEMRRLNARWLGHDRPTDVLAFGLPGPGAPRLLGEVVISADTAARQARRLGVSVALELDLLLVHGVLHLLGWDDHDAREARLMHQRAREILSQGRRRLPARLWDGLLPRP